MTAVAVQQPGAHHQQYSPHQSPQSSNMTTPHHSRTQSYTSTLGAQVQAPIQNGTASAMDSRPSISNDPIRAVNGYENRASNGASSHGGQNGDSRRRHHSFDRPTSAPHSNGEQSQDEGSQDRGKAKRRPKSLLQRSKSDYGPRGEDSQTEEEIPDWGARHGFDDHYASEEFVSQLANVSTNILFMSGVDSFFNLFFASFALAAPSCSNCYVLPLLSPTSLHGTKISIFCITYNKPLIITGLRATR